MINVFGERLRAYHRFRSLGLPVNASVRLAELAIAVWTGKRAG